MPLSKRPGLTTILILTFAALSVYADDEKSETEISIFEDPFSVSSESEDGAGTNDHELDAFADPFGDANDESFSFDDFDSLFTGEMLEVAEDPGSDAAPQDDLLTAEQLRWGGRIRGSVDADWSWDNLWTPSFDPWDPRNESLTPRLSADLFFDARPDPSFRVFGKLKLEAGTDAGPDFQGTLTNVALTGNLPEGWTREEDKDGDTVIRDEDGEVVFTVPAQEEDDEPGTGSPPGVELSVFELFSDFTYRDRLFLRFGKHTIRWGLGYFFSPADVLNLTAVDAEDPTADREGPVSLRLQYPFGINNAYLYLITNAGARPDEIAVAPKIEVVVRSSELAVAAYYQRALAPRLITMLSASIKDVDLFAEALVSIGSDRTFVRRSRTSVSDLEDPPDGLELVLDTYTVGTLPFFSGTIGFRYIKDFPGNAGSIAVVSQYFYNGEGYPDSELLGPAFFLLQNPGTNGLTIDDVDLQPEGYQDPPNLGFSDIANWGRHYAAAAVNWSSIGGSDISAGVLALANLSDLSGVFNPNLSIKLFDRLSVNISARMTFGQPGDELTNPAALFAGTADDDEKGSTLSLTVGASLGGGSF